MSRQHRSIIPGNPLHITQRGNNRSSMFHDLSDYHYCMELLGKSSKKYGCAVHAYVLMGNHLHLLLTPEDRDGPARMMQSVGLNYVRYFNRRNERTGTLWEGRYRSKSIHSERYFLACSRYIELNPVRALLAEHPSKYRWSSFHSNANGKHDPLIRPHDIYQNLDVTIEGRQARYLALFAMHLDSEAHEILRDVGARPRAAIKPQRATMVKQRRQRILFVGQHGGDRRSASFKRDVATKLD
ncbi:MAG: transposase [Gemmatimonadaceae bacterium]